MEYKLLISHIHPGDIFITHMGYLTVTQVDEDEVWVCPSGVTTIGPVSWTQSVLNCAVDPSPGGCGYKFKSQFPNAVRYPDGV